MKRKKSAGEKGEVEGERKGRKRGGKMKKNRRVKEKEEKGEIEEGGTGK